MDYNTVQKGGSAKNYHSQWLIEYMFYLWYITCRGPLAGFVWRDSGHLEVSRVSCCHVWVYLSGLSSGWKGSGLVWVVTTDDINMVWIDRMIKWVESYNNLTNTILVCLGISWNTWKESIWLCVCIIVYTFCRFWHSQNPIWWHACTYGCHASVLCSHFFILYCEILLEHIYFWSVIYTLYHSRVKYRSYSGSIIK